ncbi:hypothetical protein ACOSQ3_014622 [Xanthoceras sorbifolium]
MVEAIAYPITKRFTASEEVWENYFKSHPKERHFRTKTLVDYDDLMVVIGNATASERYSIELGDNTDARVIRVEDKHVGIEDYVFDENNNAFVQSEQIPSKSTNYKKRNISDYEGKSNIWDVIKEIPKLDSFACYKAFALLDTKTKNNAFLSLEECAAWILYTLK